MTSPIVGNTKLKGCHNNLKKRDRQKNNIYIKRGMMKLKETKTNEKKGA